MSRLPLMTLLALTTVVAAQDAPDGPVEAGAAPGEVTVPAEEVTPEETLSARARYNLALNQLEAGELDGAATEFLAARDEAGPDPSLRYRAAFNLGVALAGQADTQQAQTPEQAIETLRNSAAWFNDAIRLAPESDEDARINLEIVLRRIQQLADQLNQGNRLEARLDRIIDDQRGLRDRVRRLLVMVEAEGAGAEPVGFQREFEELATFQRTLLAEAGSIGDLAAEERALIEEKAEEQRTQQEIVRAFQLQSMDHYLQQARQSLSDTRRRLRRLEGERAHRRADAALAELKRAREQLLDPVTVLKGVAQDETSLLAHTQMLALLSGGALRLDEDQAAPAPPPWLTTEHLGERQQDTTSRTGEILARLEAGTSAEAAPDADARQQRMLQAAREAVPFLRTAAGAMQDTQSALSTDALTSAVASEMEAMQALYRAIERFAGVRDLIELAFADQTKVVQLLTPEDDSPIAELSTEERTRAVSAAVDSNLDRLDRLEGLLQEELADAEAQAQHQPKAEQPDSAQMQAVRERYGLAEELRGKAAKSLETLNEALTELARSAGAAQLVPPAAETLGHLEALRRLFFSLVEHLQELLREQTETYDRTATFGFELAIDEMVPELGLVRERQGDHAATGDALARALAQQADVAAVSDQAQTPPSSDRLAEAADEVRNSSGLMHSAGALLQDAVQLAASMSPDLQPALGDQLTAMEHLENAIRLLQPPRQQPDQADRQQQQQQQQLAQQPQEEEMSQRQALRRLQAIRDREAERQRRREQQPLQREPVEKDW